jgi:hypothetical protein
VPGPDTPVRAEVVLSGCITGSAAGLVYSASTSGSPLHRIDRRAPLASPRNAPAGAPRRPFRSVLAALDPFADTHPALSHALELIEHGARVTLLGFPRPLPWAAYMAPSLPADAVVLPAEECRARLLELAAELLPEHVRVEVGVWTDAPRRVVKWAAAQRCYELVAADLPPARRRRRGLVRRQAASQLPALVVQSANA